MAPGTGLRRAVFLDRDGVLNEDIGPFTEPAALRVPAGVPEALVRLKAAGFALLVVTNQSVVARGLTTEAGLESLHEHLAGMIRARGGPAVDAFYYCPHHPKATLEAYRRECDCRKPRPGLLLRGAREHGIDLTRSFMVGDRPTDIGAGRGAGCRAVLVQTGRHLDQPIETVDPFDAGILADHTCADLGAAADWILSQR